MAEEASDLEEIESAGVVQNYLRFKVLTIVHIKIIVLVD
jgi:hypothetical protein